MKISPLAAGQNVQVNGAEAGTISPTRLERAKQIAQGIEPTEQVQSSGDARVDELNVRKIKMRTNATTNREDLVVPEEPGVEASPVIDNPDINESGTVAEETKPLSPQFAALMKAKRALQVKERELATREAALKTQSPAGNEDLLAKLKANPLNVLLENGVTYDQLTADIIAQQNGATPEIQALKAEMKALKEELNGQFVSRDQLAEQQVLSDIKKEAIALASEGDEFQAIRQARAYEDVKELVHRTWKKGWPDKGYPPGHVLDTAEAAQFVENQLIEEALPFAKLKKIQERLTPAEAAQVVAQPPTLKPNTKVMRTLTNRDSASPVMDRRARAIAAMKGTLIKG
jgi:hypothetical protein